ILEQIILHTGAEQIALAVQADHLCCQWRGVKDTSKMLTWGFHGVIENEAAIRQDILHLMNLPEND
ncbi:MAG: GTP cyclohydrolase I, partial [Pseudomonadota bacterium]